jgi:hypothetical protein
MDIENAEWKIFETIDIDYACAYFKQFLFETHLKNVPKMNLENYKKVKKLEKCFMLFRRDTRFFGQSESLYTANHGPLTEFQASFKLDLLNYGSSGEEVIWFMLSIGELYFVNKNYL